MTHRHCPRTHGIQSAPFLQRALPLVLFVTALLGRIPAGRAATGDVVAWGYAGFTNVPAAATNATAISAMANGASIVRTDGSVLTWDPAGQVSQQPASVTNIVRLESANSRLVAIRADGSVVGWTQDSTLVQTNIPVERFQAVDVGQGSTISSGLGRDGRLWFWSNTGASVSVWTNLPPLAVDLERIVFEPHNVPGYGFFGIRRDGVVVPWPYPTLDPGGPETAALTNVSRLAPGNGAVLALKDDGRISSWGYDTLVKAIPPAASNIVALAAGRYDAIALRNDGKVFVWGNRTGALTNVPPHVTNAIAVGLSDSACFAALGDGRPRFVDQIGTRIARRNEPFHLNAFAVGQPPLAYAWRKNGVEMPGATNPILAIANLEFADVGEYSVTVSNALGVVAGVVASVTVDEPTKILTQPLSQTIPAGNPVVFSVDASGSPTPTYQWQTKGSFQFSSFSSIDGATNSSLVIPHVTPANAESYRVVVSNYTRVVTSQVAMLTVTTNSQPYVSSFTAKPVVSLGEPLSLSVNLGGPGPADVQWLKNGSPFPGGSGPNLSFAKSVMADTGVYRPVLSNAFGINLGPEMPVTVVPVAVWGLWATNLPASLTNAVSLSVGGKAGFAVKADGSLAAWGTNEFGQLDIPAAATNLVSVSTEFGHVLALRSDGGVLAWGANDKGQASVPSGLDNVVAVSAGSGFSLALRSDGSVVGWGDNSYGQIDVPERATNIVAISAGYQAAIALRADKSVVVWGAPAGGMPPWANSASNAVAVAAGANMLVALTEGFAQALSWPASATGYTTEGTSVSSLSYEPIYAIEAGANHALALGFGCMQFRWNGGFLYPGIDRPPAHARNASQVSAGNYVTGALLDPLMARPFKLVAKRRGALGGTAVFSAVGSGEAAYGFYSFQWRFNGTNLPGATRPYLVLTNLTPDQAGQYSVARRVTAGLTNISETATLTVGAPAVPAFAVQPKGATNRAGADVSFQVSLAIGSSGDVLWLKDGSPLIGTFGTTLSLENVQASDVGFYSAVATNLSGSVTSTVASLIVTSAPPIILVQPASRSVVPGSAVQFAVTARGVAPLTYQWWHNGQPLPGATNALLLLPSFSFAQAGDYQVVVGGHLGAGGTITSTTASLVPGDFFGWGQSAGTPSPLAASNLLSAAIGHGFTLGLRPDGTVVAWGDSVCGAPVVPAEATNVARLAAGARTALALRTDGSLVSWKIGSPTLLAVPAEATRIVEIAEGALFHLALRQDGRVVAWSESAGLTIDPPAALSNAMKIAAGSFHALALRRDGTVTAWGRMNSVPTEATNVVQIAAGETFSVALRSDGRVVAWGELQEPNATTADITCGGYNISYGTINQTNRITVPAEATNIVAIAAGLNHILALRADGKIIAWGDNGYGQLNVPTGGTISDIVAGGFGSLALVRSGKPVFGSYPTNLSVVEGRPALVNPAILGRDPFDVRWFKDGSVGPVSSNRFLFIEAVTTATAGDYHPVVTGGGLSVTGAVAHIALVPGAPFIVGQPQSLTSTFNGDPTFAVTASGTGPLTYQWRSGGVALTEAVGAREGTRSPTLTLRAVQIGTNFLDVVVSNAHGSVTSAVARLSVVPINPLADALNNGLVWTTGGAPGGWTWQQAVTHDGFSALQSGPLSEPGTNWLEATVIGPTTVSFWWKTSIIWSKLRLLIDGVAAASLSNENDWTWNAVNVPAGAHVLRWVDERSLPSGFSASTAWLDEVKINHQVGPLFTQSPASRSVLLGDSTTLSAAVVGSEPLSLQWQRSGVDIVGATNTSLTLSGVQAAAAGVYRLRASNEVAVAFSGEATVSIVTSGPSLSGGKEVIVAGPGTVAALEWTVNGPPSSSLQWLFNGQAIPGATNASLVFSNVQPSHAGNYRLAVSSDVGSITSSETRLAVVPIAAWGSNDKNQTLVWEWLTDVQTLSAAGNRTLYIREGQIPWMSGAYDSSKPSYLPNSTNVTKLSSRADLDVGLQSDGALVFGWGATNLVNPIPTNLNPAKDVAAGSMHVVVVDQDGGLVCFGDNSAGQCVPPAGATNRIIAVAAGRAFSVALREDGRVFSWGTNLDGFITAPPDATNIVAIAAGNEYAIGLRADGSLAVWGRIAPPPTVTNSVGIAGGDLSGYAIHPEGTLTSWGGGLAVPAQPPYLSNVVMVAGGSNHAWALIGDGKPVITVEPRSRLAGPSGSTLLVVKATGAGHLAYQWQRDGQDLPGETYDTLAVSEAGTYRVAIRNALGMVESIEATVTAPRPPLVFDRSPGSLAFGDDGFRFRLLGLSGSRPLVIYASTNLMDWLPIFTNPPAAGPLEILDPAAPAHRQRYYRAGE